MLEAHVKIDLLQPEKYKQPRNESSVNTISILNVVISYLFQKTGISSQGVLVLLSSKVSNVMKIKKSPNAEAKCQIS